MTTTPAKPRLKLSGLRAHDAEIRAMAADGRTATQIAEALGCSVCDVRAYGSRNRIELANGNLGKKRSPETIEKIRLAKLGKKLSPETIEKIRLAKSKNGILVPAHLRSYAQKLRSAGISGEAFRDAIRAAALAPALAQFEEELRSLQARTNAQLADRAKTRARPAQASVAAPQEMPGAPPTERAAS